MKKIVNAFIGVVLIAFLMMIAYYKVPFFQEKITRLTEESFVEENIYSDIESISNRLDQEILNGSDSFVIFLKDMDVNEINQINNLLDGVFGGGESYQEIGSIGNSYKKVSITVKRNANYYAYAAYKNHSPIPEKEEKARKLYRVICQIMKTQIAEDMTDYEKELALHDYLVTHCVYSEDANQQPGSDIYRAYGALVNQNAVCNGYAEAMHILMMCAEVQTQFVIGTADGIDHAWNLVQLDGSWYHLDSTWDDPKPDQRNEALHPYFNVNDSVMEQKHTWDTSRYPKAEDTTYNYYVQQDAYFKDVETYQECAYEQMVTKGRPMYEAVVEDYAVESNDMQFVFMGNSRYKSISWQVFEAGKYKVLVLKGE